MTTNKSYPMNTQLSHSDTQLPATGVQQKSIGGKRLLASSRVLIILSVCMALQMTSFVMILPLFSRRLTDFGAGVEALGLSSMMFALTSTVAAPFMGALADRFGRRPLVLISLAVYVLVFSGYLFVSSALMFIVLRGFAGAFTAGLIPAVMGMVADLAPSERRAQWIGIVNGGASAGWIVGPVLGGLLYDRWGFAVPACLSIMMALAAFTLALGAIPETLRHLEQRKCGLRLDYRNSSVSAIRQSLPQSLSVFAILLSICFAVLFAWAFIEPQFMFYTYDTLGWSASMLGWVMSTFGVAMMLGEFSLSRLSDRLGRRPVIVLGLVLFSAQFLGLALFHNYVLIAVAFVIAGLGNALFDPALSASILDIAPPEHRARSLGIKSTVGSLGSILGPALVVAVGPFVQAQGIFLIATGIVLLIALISLSIHISPRSIEAASN
jgi:MFS family permease